MNAYYNIANNNQSEAASLAEQYGFSPSNTEELSECLERIVADYGKDGLQKVMYLHPDKSIILELFAGSPIDSKEGRFKMNMQNIKRGYASNGDTSSMDSTPKNNNVVSQTSVMIVISALLISVAIIASNK